MVVEDSITNGAVSKGHKMGLRAALFPLIMGLLKSKNGGIGGI